MDAAQVRRAFITGSRRYGAPRLDSDVDLVVLVDEQTFETLIQNHEGEGVGNFYAPIRFGKLNVIAVKDIAEFDHWNQATLELEAQAKLTGQPVDRETARQRIKGPVRW